MRMRVVLTAMAAVGFACAAVPARATTEVPVVAQGLGAGPLQGPLASPSSNAAIACRPVHRVARRHARGVRRAPRVLVAAAPVVPLVPYYRPVYVYRPFVPFVAYRPFYRPFFYGRGFY